MKNFALNRTEILLLQSMEFREYLKEKGEKLDLEYKTTNEMRIEACLNRLDYNIDILLALLKPSKSE